MLPDGYAVMDLETTGLNPDTCLITEIAVLLALPGQEPDVESRLIKLGVSLPPEIVKMTGITDELLQEQGIPFADALEWLMERVDGLKIVGHNIFRFDLPVLMNNIGRNDPGTTVALEIDRFIDTAAIYKGLKLALRRKRGRSHHQYAMEVLDTRAQGVYYGLDAACSEMRIRTDDVSRHRAAGDATITYRLFEALMAHYQNLK